jgi:hypothetical protein
LRREPHELPQAFDRRLDKYIHRRLKTLAVTLIAIDRERAGLPPDEPEAA